MTPRPMKMLDRLAGMALVLATLVLANRTVAGRELTFESRPGQRASLLELYTSEGCSSCPPAEAWLSRLTTSPQLWTQIVPVAFHVDYWDNPGWRDRFASQAWTARQRAYAARWASDSVYTPAFVLDGQEWRAWSIIGGSPLPARRTPEGAGRLQAVAKDGKTVTVVYRPADRSGAEYQVSVALLGFNLNSRVSGGENRGRNLRHDFVVLACETKTLSPANLEHGALFELPAPPADAKRLALAIWVEEPRRSCVQQATGGWLTDASVPQPAPSNPP